MDVRADLAEIARHHADRARRPVWEAWVVEPGLQGMGCYRLGRYFYQRKRYFLARCCQALGRVLAGVDIHPGARIGKRCMILHGGGVVVGETAVLGDDCVLEAGAMLIGGSMAPIAVSEQVHMDPAGAIARTHPSLGHRVVIEAGALVIGDVFLGNDVRVMAGSVVTRDVADGGLALGVPGRVLPRAQARPDPDARAVQALATRVYQLEEQLQVLAFAAQRTLGAPPRTRKADEFGPIAAVEALIDGAGI